MKTKDKNKSNKQFNILIKSISKGDKRALENFYIQYGKLIYSVALSVSKTQFLANEIVNDVLVKIWQASQVSKKIDNPVGWLYRIAFNCSIDRVKNERQMYEIYDMPQDDENIDRLLTEDAFYFYISYLNEDERNVFILRFIQDLSFAEIAKEVNKPLSTVSSTYYRAIEKLKCSLK